MYSLWSPDSRPSCSSDPRELDAKLFAHIHLDSRLVGTNLEGEDFTRTTAYVLKVLNFLNDPKHEILDTEKRKRIAASLKQVSEDFQTLTENAVLLKEARKKLAAAKSLSIADIETHYLKPIVTKIIEKLNSNGEVLIPGGWVGSHDEPGHGMCYQITRDPKRGGYQFLVYNMGAGLEFHPKKGKTGKWFPVKAYHIPSGQESSEKIAGFLSELLRPELWPARSSVTDSEPDPSKPDKVLVDWHRMKRFDATRVYTEMQNSLALMHAKEYNQKELEDITLMSTQGQLSGTCAMRVLMPVLHKHLKGGAFQQFLYQFRMQSIIDYYRLKRDANELHLASVQRQLGAAVDKFARTTRKFMTRHKNHTPVLTSNQVQASLELIDHIQKNLRQASFSHQKRDREVKKISEWDMSIGADDSFINDSKQTLKWTGDGKLSGKGKDGKEAEESAKESPEDAKKHQDEFDSIRNKRLPQWQEVSDPIEFLKNSADICRDYEKSGEHELLLNEIEKMFLSLPLELKTATAYWEKLNRDSAMAALNHLHMLFRMYGKACEKLSPYPAARQTIASHSMMLTASFLANTFFKEVPKLKYLVHSLPYSGHEFNLQIKGIKGTSFDPSLDKRIEEIALLYQKMDALKFERRGGMILQDYYDIAYLESCFGYLQGSAEIQTLAKHSENLGADLVDKARYNFLSMVGFEIPWSLPSEQYRKISDAVHNYDIFLQFNQLMREASLFKDGGFSYFEGIATDKSAFQKSGYRRRMRIDVETDVTKLESFSNLSRKYRYGDNTEATSVRGNNSLKDLLQFKNSFLESLAFDMAPDESNRRVIESTSKKWDFLPESFPSRSLPFAYNRDNETRIGSTLDFIDGNLEDLEEEEFQNILLLAFFSPPPALLQAIVRNPELAEKMLVLLDKALKLHTESKTAMLSSGGIFALKLGITLRKYLMSLPLEKRGLKPIAESLKKLYGFENVLHEQIEIYRKSLAVGGRRKAEKTKRFEELLGIHFQTNSEKQDVKYSSKELRNMLLYPLIRNIKSHNYTHSSFLGLDLIRSLASEQARLKAAFLSLSTPEQEKMAREIANMILVPDILPNRDFEVKIHFPKVMVSSKGSIPITVDLLAGTVKALGSRVGYIEPNFFRDKARDTFLNFFGSLPIKALIEEKESYAVCHFTQNGRKYQVRVDMSKALDSIDVISNLGRKGSALDEDVWYEMISPNSLFFVQPGFRYGNNNNYNWWRSLKSPPVFVCTDKKDNFIVQLEPESFKTPETGETRYRSYELTTTGEKTGYTTLWDRAAPDSWYRHFAQFENPKYIEILHAYESKIREDQNATQLKVRMPRYDLELIGNKNKEGRLELRWRENTDYRLFSGINAEVIRGFPHVLCFENTKSKSKETSRTVVEESTKDSAKDILVLIPKQEFYVPNLERFDEEYRHMEYDINNEIPSNAIEKLQDGLNWQSSSTEHYYKFKLKDGKLLASSGPAYLQLAYIYLAKHDPLNARWALMQCYKLGGIRGTQEEIDLIRNIIEGIPSKDYRPTRNYALSKTNEPETIAVRLFAGGLLSKQKQMSLNTPQFAIAEPGRERENFKTADDFYEYYKNQKLSEFYKFDFHVQLSSNLKHYYKIKGNVPEDMQLPPDMELQLQQEVSRETLFSESQFPLSAISVQPTSKSSLRAREASIPPNAEMVPLSKKLPELMSALQETRKKHAEQMQNLLKTSTEKPVTSLDRKIDHEPFYDSEKQKFKRDLEQGQEINRLKLDERRLFGSFFKKASDLKAIKDALDQPESASVLSEARALLKNLEDELIENANAILSGKKIIETTPTVRSEVLGGIRRQLKLPDLIWLYLQNDRTLFKSRTLLDDKSIEELYQKIHEYLIQKTLQQQRLRVYETLQKLESTATDSSEYQSYLTELGYRLTDLRHYPAELHPEALVFECLDDKLISRPQFEIIERLTQKKEPKELKAEQEGVVTGGYAGEVIQLIMGGGKSKVLLPLLAAKKADGSNLSIIEVPDALFETNLADLQETTQRLFGIAGFPFKFDRDSDCSSKNLQSLLEGLKQTISNRQYLITTAESIQSLQLKYLELLERVGKGSIEQGRGIGPGRHELLLIEEMLKLIQERGDVLIDECDTILDPKRELNYTQGDPGAPDPEVLAAILAMYRLFDKVPVSLPQGSFTLNQVLKGKAVIIEEKHWNNVFDELATMLVGDENSPIYNFAKNLDMNNKITLIQYLLNDFQLSSEETTRDSDRKKPVKAKKAVKVPKFVQEATLEQKKILGLLKGELALLKTTLRRKPNENYGFPKSPDYKGSFEIAIPYIANNTPNEKAQFGSVFEIINYTIQLQYQRKLLSPELIKEFVAIYKKRAKSEAEGLSRAAIDNSKAGIEFLELTGIKLSMVDLENKTKFEKIVRKISESDAARDFIILKLILPKIKQYPNILRSNAINHVSQFRSAQAMSGTPWNASCYHTMLKFNESLSLGTDGRTIDLFRNKDKEKSCIKILDEKTPDEIITKRIVEHETSEKVHALIDVGALFKGISNFDIALVLAEKLQTRKDNKVRHILYFNEDNELCALPVGTPIRKENVIIFPKSIVIGGTDKELILQKTGSTPDQCFTYYDQRHTTGTDIKQTPDAIGIVTVDDDTRARDLWQGLMRLRDFSLNQNAEILVPKALAASFPRRKKWSADDLIALVEDNQLKSLAEINLHAAFDKMDDLLRTQILALMYSAEGVEEKQRLYQNFMTAFKIEMQDDPFQKFGGVEQLKDTESILQHYAKECIIRFENLIKESGLEGSLKSTENSLDLMKSRIQKSLNTICLDAKAHCLVQYKYLPSQDEQRSVEVQRLKEKRKETKKEKQKETERLLRDTELVAASYKSWRGGFPISVKEGLESETSIAIKPVTELFKSGSAFNFSRNIFVSENYQNTALLSTSPEALLKPLNYFLLLKDAAGELKTLIITQDEAREFLGYFDANRDVLKKQGIDAWIASPRGTMLDGTAPYPPDHKDYASIVQQIQFLSGDIDKLAETKSFEWIMSDNIIEKIKFLNNTILRLYPEKRKFFEVFKEKFDDILKSRLKDIKVTHEELQKAVQEGDIKNFSALLQELHRVTDRAIQNYILNSYEVDSESPHACDSVW